MVAMIVPANSLSRLWVPCTVSFKSDLNLWKLCQSNNWAQLHKMSAALCLCIWAENSCCRLSRTCLYQRQLLPRLPCVINSKLGRDRRTSVWPRACISASQSRPIYILWRHARMSYIYSQSTGIDYSARFCGNLYASQTYLSLSKHLKTKVR